MNQGDRVRLRLLATAKRSIWTPEQRLCAEMLLLAIRDVRARYANQREGEQLREEALAWMNDGTGGLSFDACCEALGFDAAGVRRAFVMTMSLTNAPRRRPNLGRTTKTG